MDRVYEEGSRGTPDFPYKMYIMETENGKISIEPQRHNDTEFIYIDKGEINLTVSGIIYTCREGDIYMINPREIHSVSCVEKYVKYYAFVFDMELLNMKNENNFQTMYIKPFLAVRF